jgi:hypothetical protein
MSTASKAACCHPFEGTGDDNAYDRLVKSKGGKLTDWPRGAGVGFALSSLETGDPSMHFRFGRLYGDRR